MSDSRAVNISERETIQSNRIVESIIRSQERPCEEHDTDFMMTCEEEALGGIIVALCLVLCVN